MISLIHSLKEKNTVNIFSQFQNKSYKANIKKGQQ